MLSETPQDIQKEWKHQPGLWIGPQFSAGFRDRRILVAVEAFPSEASAFRVGRGMSADLVDGYVKGTVKHRLFTDLARVVAAAPIERESCTAFFDAIALSQLPFEPSGGQLGSPHRGVAQPSDFLGVPQRLGALVQMLEPSDLLVLGRQLCDSVKGWKAGQDQSEPKVHMITHPACDGYSFRKCAHETAALRSSFEPE